MIIRCAAAIGAVALFVGAAAQAQNSECLTYDRYYETAPLFRIKAGASRVNFHSRPRPCPPGAPCRWRQKAYLLPGDIVLAGPEQSGFRCAYYGTAKGILIAGFLPAANLEPSAEGRLSAEFLSGAWKMSLGPAMTPNSIEIQPAGTHRVSASGDAYYQTEQTVNEGSFSCSGAAVADNAAQVIFRDGACEVTVRRRGPYLVAADNGNCGGLNVSFEGIYTKVRPRPRSR